MSRPETQVTILPPAGREAQLELWGITRSHRWGEAERRPRYAAEELEPTDDDVVDGHELEELGFLLDGGWHAVDTTRGTSRMTGFTPGAKDAGMSSHRGVLHPDEHVDADALRAAIEAELGFTYDDVRSVYRQGRMTPAQLELRARIGARLLELSESGGQMLELARAFGWTIKAASSSGGRSCDTLERALARARNERSATS